MRPTGHPVASFWKPSCEHSVLHSEPGLVEFEQLAMSIKAFKGRFIEASQVLTVHHSQDSNLSGKPVRNVLIIHKLKIKPFWISINTIFACLSCCSRNIIKRIRFICRFCWFSRLSTIWFPVWLPIWLPVWFSVRFSVWFTVRFWRFSWFNWFVHRCEWDPIF